MNGATPESQAVVVRAALASEFRHAVQGRDKMAHCVTVSGAKPGDRNKIYRIATRFAHGFAIRLRWLSGGYFMVELYHSEDNNGKAQASSGESYTA